MKPAYIYIGLAAVAVISTGLFIRELFKKEIEKQKDLEAYNTFLEEYIKEVEVVAAEEAVSKFSEISAN